MSHAAPIAATAWFGSALKGKFVALAGASLLAAFWLAGAPAFAEEPADEGEATPAPHLLLELNGLQASERGCRLTFMAANRLGGELSSAAFELVLFDGAGMVSRLTIVDFKDLPEGKTKVRQFDFAGIDCADVGRILVNDATECVGEGLEPRACIRGLRAETRSDIVFGT